MDGFWERTTCEIYSQIDYVLVLTHVDGRNGIHARKNFHLLMKHNNFHTHNNFHSRISSHQNRSLEIDG